MEESVDYRRLGKTGYRVSAIGFGAWPIGSDYGPTDDATSLKALHAAADAGVTFFDTADVYGDGRSERVIGQFLKQRAGERLYVATKIGQRVPLDVANYSAAAFRGWIDDCRTNLQLDQLDLVQLHCLPTGIYYRPDLFEAMDQMVEAGVIAHYGVSVEKVEEALKAIEYPGVASVQLIFNVLRQRPIDRFFGEAASRDVGIIARVPLASGLLTGKFNAASTFDSTDHRSYNRHGEEFDVGETFAGVDFETGLSIVEELRPLVPPDASLAQLALRWILMHDAVSTAIPGAKTPDQARANAAAADLAPLSPATMAAVDEIYRTRVKPLVHQRW
jgi:aryl-alcohol dehydrogenase-like predicted oxidoreductase